MRLIRLLPLALCGAVVAAAENGGVVERVAHHMTLGNGENVDVLAFSKGESTPATSTCFVRDNAGTALTITVRHDARWYADEITLRSGKDMLTLRVGLGFLKDDNLPQPYEVKIGDKVYRAIMGKPTEYREAWAKVYAAVRRLPARFLSAVRTTYIATDSVDTAENSGLPPALILLGDLFEEEIPRVPVLSSVPMKPEEVEILRVQAAGP